MQQELIPPFKKLMEEISENYKRIADANERRAVAQERQVAVLVGIAEHLGIELPEKIESFEDKTDSFSVTETKPVESADDTSDNSVDFNNDFDKQKIMNTILEMRKNKVSYGKIAQHLRSQGIPTFSGRGTWHGQTVSRLIN
jgi:hypothetical protein